MHVSRKGQAAHQRERAEAVDHVVDVKPVTGTLALANAGKCAIQRISQPVQGEAGDDAHQRVTVAGSEGVEHSGADLRRQAENGEMVGADLRGRVGGQP